MKIGIDCKALVDGSATRQPGGSISHGVYTYNLIRFLRTLDSNNEYILYVQDDCKCEIDGNFKTKKMGTFHTNAYLRAILTFPLELRRNPVDIFHGMHAVPIVNLKKIVLTMFEFTCLTNPEYYPRVRSMPVGYMMKKAVENADRIIAPSEFIKGEIVNYFNITDDLVDVVHLGVDEDFFARRKPVDISNTKKRYKIDANYILAVGDIWPKKNIDRLIDAFCILKKSSDVEHKLVLIGEKLWGYEKIFQKSSALQIQDDIVVTENIKLEELKLLYQGADLFVFPSLYEGFGLPLLEAMASGVPVVASKFSSLPEVAGEAAVYFDPLDVENIAETMLKVLCDADLRQQLIKKGATRARSFPWSEVARKTLSVYQNLYC